MLVATEKNKECTYFGFHIVLCDFVPEQVVQLSEEGDVLDDRHFSMCCGFEQEMMEHYGDVKKLTSSVLRKKRFNRNRRHPSMQIDAVLTSTLRLLKDEELTNAVSESRCRKRPSSSPSSTSTLKRKKSRWDVRTKEPRVLEMDEELENMIGMNKFFQRLNEASNKSVREDGELSTARKASVGDQEEGSGPHTSDQSVASSSP